MPIKKYDVAISSQQKLQNTSQHPHESLQDKAYYPTTTETPKKVIQGISRFTASHQELKGIFRVSEDKWGRQKNDLEVINREYSSGKGLEIPLDMTSRIINSLNEEVHSISEVLNKVTSNKFIETLSSSLDPMKAIIDLEPHQIASKLGYSKPKITLIKETTGYGGKFEQVVLPMDKDSNFFKQITPTFQNYDQVKLTSYIPNPPKWWEKN